jgi:hypothetical protein
MSGNGKRKSGQDRRDHEEEKGPPTGWKDRRRAPERRLPEVKEISPEEFVELMKKANEQNK